MIKLSHRNSQLLRGSLLSEEEGVNAFVDDLHLT